MKAICSAILLAALCGSPALAIEPGQPAPEFTLKDAADHDVALSSFHGRYVYVDFWASWCGPCRLSFPWMNKLRARYPAERLAVVAINLDKKRADADQFLTENSPAFSILFDPAGSTPSRYQVPTMPSSYLIDPGGKVISVHRGFKNSSAPDLDAELATLLEAKP